MKFFRNQLAERASEQRVVVKSCKGTNPLETAAKLKTTTQISSRVVTKTHFNDASRDRYLLFKLKMGHSEERAETIRLKERRNMRR